jgi:hypothetical protein
MRHEPDQLDRELAHLGNELNHTRDAMLRAMLANDFEVVASLARDAALTRNELNRATARKFERVRASMEVEKAEQRRAAVARSVESRRAKR